MYKVATEKKIGTKPNSPKRTCSQPLTWDITNQPNWKEILFRLKVCPKRCMIQKAEFVKQVRWFFEHALSCEL
jgi:hypothetical protein